MSDGDPSEAYVPSDPRNQGILVIDSKVAWIALVVVVALVLGVFMIGRNSSTSGGADSESTNSGPSGHYVQKCHKEMQTTDYDPDPTIISDNFSSKTWVDVCRNVWVAD